MSTGACATKSDIRDLQSSMAAMEQRQEQSIQDLAIQNRMLLDSLRNSLNLQRDAQGQTSHRFQQLTQQVERLEEVIGQTIQYINTLNDRLAQLAQQAQQVPQATGVPSSGNTSAEEMYALGVQKMDEGAFATARAAFQAVIRDFAQDPRAADAQYQIAETYYQEEEYDSALEELDRVPQQWPSSPRAAAALYRAGFIAEERDMTTRARRYYEQVRQRYPDSDEARQAQARLRSLR